jgi:hypothetical protein
MRKNQGAKNKFENVGIFSLTGMWLGIRMGEIFSRGEGIK